MRIDGKADVSPVVFRDEEALPLLGAVTLEILSLGIDPVNRRLIPLDALLLPALARPEQETALRPRYDEVSALSAASRLT